MVTLGREKLQLLILILLSWLILWNGSWEFRPSMDAMTYGALAQNILSTGDWRVLHYSNQAYAEFYQHPPLVMWMTAVVFKFLGSSDITQKILPNLFAVLCVAGVFAWGARWRTRWWGFVAGVVLLSSVRFTKYSVGLLLDPFLAAFMLWSVFFARAALDGERSEHGPRDLGFTFLSGLMLTCAFLSKGIPAFAALLISLVLLGSGIVGNPKRTFARLGVFLLGLGVPLLFWFTLGGGLPFLKHYWTTSVAGRMGGDILWGHLAPGANLLKVYWPWLPFWVWGVCAALWALRNRRLREWLRGPSTIGALGSLAVLGGFTLSGHFLEQYLVPFYPFAALVVADQVSDRARRFERGILVFLFWFAIAYSMILAALPLHVQGTEYLNPIRILVSRAPRECDGSKISRLHFSTGVAEIWYATAMGLWYTPWDVHSDAAEVGPEASGSQVLLARRGEAVHSDWAPTSLTESEYRLYQKKDLGACPSALP